MPRAPAAEPRSPWRVRALVLGLAAAAGFGAAGLGIWVLDGGPTTASPAALAGNAGDAAPAPSDAAPTRGFAEMLAASSPEVQVARYAGNGRVLVIDFPSLRRQGEAMNRIAALVEKNGAPRDRLLDDVELASLIVGGGDNADVFYIGHDYRASDLARFFTLAETDDVALTAAERWLAETLIGQGLIARDGDVYRAAAPEQAVVSVSQVQADDPATPQSELIDGALRATTLRHELSHGQFFTDASYRDYVLRFWRDEMTDAERTLFRTFLGGANYDPTDEELMANEMQAYLMFTPDTRMFDAAHLGTTGAAVDALRERFRAGAPAVPLLDEPAAP